MPTTPELVHPNSMPIVSELFGLPVREDVLFTDAKGKASTSIRKDAERLLRNLQEPLRLTLRKGEAILYAMQLSAPMNIVEQLTMTWWMYSAYSVALVVTTERIYAFHVTREGAWRCGINSLDFGDMQSSKVGGWILGRTLTLNSIDGKKTTYQRMKWRDAKKLKVVLPVLENSRTATAASRWQSWCPSCGTALIPRVYQCAHCGQVFRTEKGLLRRLWIPGGGYFYARLSAIGSIIAVLEAIFLLEVAVSFLLLLSSNTPQDRANGLAALIFFVPVLLIEKGATYLHTRRFVMDFIPEKNVIAVPMQLNQ